MLIIFAITETWLTDSDMACKAEITLPGYKLLEHSRIGRPGGGSALIFRDNITVQKLMVASAGHLNFLNGFCNIAPVSLELLSYIALHILLHILLLRVFFWTNSLRIWNQ